MTKVYSADGEYYEHDFPSELGSGDVYYEVDLVPDRPDYYITNNHIEHLLSWFDEDLVSQYEEPKDSDCCFSNVTASAVNDLRFMIISWAQKNVEMKTDRIENAVEKIVT